MSVIKFIRTNPNVNKSVTTTNTVKLLVQTASTAYLASQGHPKTTSTDTDPVINPARSKPDSVRGAIMAF